MKKASSFDSLTKKIARQGHAQGVKVDANLRKKLLMRGYMQNGPLWVKNTDYAYLEKWKPRSDITEIAAEWALWQWFKTGRNTAFEVDPAITLQEEHEWTPIEILLKEAYNAKT